jgi:hypothetical protein
MKTKEMTVTAKCGHEVKVSYSYETSEVVAETMANREAAINEAKSKALEFDCDNCLKVREYNRRAKEVESTMPIIIGSEKQIAYASSLRKQLIVNLESNKMDAEAMPDMYKISNILVFKFESIKNETSASKIIDALR